MRGADDDSFYVCGVSALVCFTRDFARELRRFFAFAGARLLSQTAGTVTKRSFRGTDFSALKKKKSIFFPPSLVLYVALSPYFSLSRFYLLFRLSAVDSRQYFPWFSFHGASYVQQLFVFLSAGFVFLKRFFSRG